MTLFEEASMFAIKAHAGMVRKKEQIPYILHPMEVAGIASTMTHDQELLAAAILHDTVEDTDTTMEDIESNFGSRVAELVASETENKHEESPAEETWELRKRESLAVLENTDDLDIKILWLSDKLSNMRSFYRLWQKLGSTLWDGFHQNDPAKQEWYYRTILDSTSELKASNAWQEYKALTDKVFGEV